MTAIASVDWRFQLLALLRNADGARVMSTSDLVELAARARPGVALVTARHAIEGLVACGALRKAAHGLYLNRNATPAVSEVELAQAIRGGSAVSLESVLYECRAIQQAPEHVTAVVPLSDESRPNVGKVSTQTGLKFRFHALPQRFWPRTKRDERRMMQPGRYCKVFAPEAAALQLAYLGTSPRSTARFQHNSIDLSVLNSTVLSELAQHYGLEEALEALLSKRAAT